jgi:hypothetical protein
VKKIANIVLLIPVVVLYCFFSGGYSTDRLVPERPVSHSSNEKDHTSIGSAILFHRATLSENAGTIFNPVPFSQKNKLSFTWSCRKITELTLSHHYSKYLFFSKNIIEWFRQTDIIFPFHYFW